VTIAIWFYATESGVIVDELGQPTPNAGWHDSQIEILSTGEVKVRVWNLAPVSLGTTTFNSWNHAVVRFNTTTNTLDGFLNGTKSSSTSLGERQYPNNNLGSSIYYAIGVSDFTNTGDGTYFGGKFDDFRVYNRALSDNEVLRIYSQDTRWELHNSNLGSIKLTCNLTSAGGLTLGGISSQNISDIAEVSGGSSVSGVGLANVVYNLTSAGGLTLGGISFKILVILRRLAEDHRLVAWGQKRRFTTPQRLVVHVLGVLGQYQ